LERERWLAAWNHKLLDCAHHHIIFTVPHQLIPLWRYNKVPFARILFRAAIDALRKLLDDPKYLGAVPGMLAAMHTWGQTLVAHPHVHVMVTAGGMTSDGQWRQPKKECLLPRTVLMAIFRGKMRDYLLDALKTGVLPVPHFQMVRAYGLYANSKGADLGAARRQLGPSACGEAVRIDWRQAWQRWGRAELTACAVCGAPLEQWLRFPAGRGPPPGWNGWESWYRGAG